MRDKAGLYEGKFHETAGYIQSILIIAAGITFQTQLYSFRYIFMFCAAAFVLITIAMLDTASQLKEILRKKIILSLFLGYVFICTAVKQAAVIIGSGISSSILSGFGNVIYIAFGMFLMSVCSDRKKIVFFVSYIISFTVIFLFTGFRTLYDFGNVCRTIGAYLNPNILSVHAAVSLFASLIMIKTIKKPYRYVFAVTASVAAAAVVNSSSRAIIIGMIISAAAAAVLFALKARRAPKISKESVLVWAAVLILSAVLVLIYFPVHENAVIDYVTDEPHTSSGEDKQTTISGADRFIKNDGLSVVASYKNNMRFVIWTEYAENMGDFFWFGISSAAKETMYIDAFGADYNPHNTLIYVFYKYGIFGFILFCLLLVQICSMVFKSRSLNRTWILMLICLGTLLFYGQLHDAANKAVFWVVVAAFLYFRDDEVSQHSEKAEL